MNSSNSDEALDKRVQQLLDFIPIQHEDNDYQTCSSLYHECSYPDAKKSSKTVRQFANGYECIAKSYFNSNKECRHPRKYWNPGKCDCGAVREQKDAKAQINKLILKAQKFELEEVIDFERTNPGKAVVYVGARLGEVSTQMEKL